MGLPGVFEIAVIPGSFVPDDCHIETLEEMPGLLEEPVACVAYPLHGPEAARDWDSIYTSALYDEGWRLIGGAGNQYWLVRPIEGSDCSDWLNMTGWVLTDSDGIARITSGEADFTDFEFGTFLFDANEALCGDRRFWLEDRRETTE